MFTEEKASDEYVSNVVERIKKLVDRIPKESNFQHIHHFLSTLENHITTKRTPLPKEILIYLNKLYKTKGIK